jgi:hypothetical protein
MTPREPSEDDWDTLMAIDPEEYAALVVDDADARREP